jgi:hypothetical protein
MVTEAADCCSQSWIVGNDGARIAIGPEVLAGIEAEASGVTPRSGFATIPRRSLCLCRILYDKQAALRGKVADRAYVGHVPIEVNGNDCSRSGG